MILIIHLRFAYVSKEKGNYKITLHTLLKTIKNIKRMQLIEFQLIFLVYKN